MLVGTAADALRPYIPKPMKKLFLERRKFWKKLTFSIKWNIRNILRHKARSLMTLLGVFGCMLLIVGGLGMKDTMQRFIKMLDETSNYATKINIIENADNSEVISICDNMNGYWQSSAGISCNGDTITLDIYGGNNDKIHILNEKDSLITPNDNGAYLCLRLKDIAKINDIIEISPYGSDKTYQLRVAGYFRSLVNESIVITEAYADKLDIEYNIDSIYCDLSAGEIESSEIIAGKHDKETLMESYGTFLEIMNLMIVILIIAAMILGIIVLYILGTMGYLERYRELATLKVLGFRDKIIGWLLINQNIWLTIIGIIIGIPGGAGVLYVLIKTLASEYELSISIGIFTYIISIALTFGVSLLVGIIIARKSRNIDMVEALKSSE